MQEKVFITKEIPCPVCQLHSTLRYPDPRYYVAGSRESDLHVTSYRWNYEGCEGIQPQYYAIWQCPVCMFAEMAERVEKPEETSRDETLIEAYVSIPDEKRNVLQSLRKLVPTGELDFNSAVALHISAILVTTLPEEPSIDFDKLGRLSLRLGWLYRERLGKIAEPELEEGSLGKLHEEVARLESQVLSMAEVLSDAERAAVARLEELKIPVDSKANPYSSITASFNEKLDEMKAMLLIVQRALLHDQRGDLEEIVVGDPGKQTDLDELIASLKDQWPELPVNEEQSLRMAVEAYEHCYNNQSEYQSVEQSITVLSLMVDILARIGDYEWAMKWIAEIYNTGMFYKRELRSRIATGKRTHKLRAHEEESIQRKISNIDIAISQAGENRRRMLDLLIEKHDFDIQKVLSETEGKTLAEREKKLEEAGIPQEVISQLKVRKILTEKKRGLFS